MTDIDPDPPCCDYRDHSGQFCSCPDHPVSDLHPYGYNEDEVGG